MYSHNYLIWKEGQTFSRVAGVVRARLDEMLVMATLGVTMALGTVGMTAEAAAQTDKAQTNVQTQQAAADTKVQGESNVNYPRLKSRA